MDNVWQTYGFGADAGCGARWEVRALKGWRCGRAGRGWPFRYSVDQGAERPVAPPCGWIETKVDAGRAAPPFVVGLRLLFNAQRLRSKNFSDCRGAVGFCPRSLTPCTRCADEIGILLTRLPLSGRRKYDCLHAACNWSLAKAGRQSGGGGVDCRRKAGRIARFDLTPER